MQNRETLKPKLKAIDKADYGAYQSLKGEYDFSSFKLIIQQIPKDPYAPPHTGIYRLQVPFADTQDLGCKLDSKTKQIAFRDYLARHFYNACQKISKGRRGTGYSGVITINKPAQAILERSCVILQSGLIEVRFFIGLPADGRKINATLAELMIFKELPEIVDQSLLKQSLDIDNLIKHINTALDAEYLRRQLEPLDLVAFIADGAILPRESGISDKPMNKASAIPFKTPPSLSTEVKLPHAGTITGMGIPAGVTLIVGGGFHGKSTLLKAIEAGIYNHIPGDGREKCITIAKAVKIRAYSGRYVEKVDISSFIKDLPLQKDTRAFCTENASGSTSQAASIMEAIEAGTELLLMDEDTCATNFMIRDKKMQELVNKQDEPITTFIDKAKQLFAEMNISTILVLGGIGDYFDVSDKVIQMLKYIPIDVTEKAKQISRTAPVKRIIEDKGKALDLRERIPLKSSLDPHNEYGKKRIYATEVHRLTFGKNTIDLTDLEQLIELSQTKAISQALDYATRYMDGKNTIKQIIKQVNQDLEQKGLDILSQKVSGNYAQFRELELAFALNRLASLKVEQKL